MWVEIRRQYIEGPGIQKNTVQLVPTWMTERNEDGSPMTNVDRLLLKSGGEDGAEMVALPLPSLDCCIPQSAPIVYKGEGKKSRMDSWPLPNSLQGQTTTTGMAE